MKVSIKRADTRYVSLATMPPGYGEIGDSWNQAGDPPQRYRGRVIFKRLSDGKVFWDDNKEVVIPDEIREAQIVMLDQGDVITKELESQDAPMK